MDGVNTLVVGYFILVLFNILYLSEINDLKLDHFLSNNMYSSIIS